MMPTKDQRKKLQNALISAFPERVLLEQLLDYELDKKLNQITQDSNLQTVVYQLIQRAQAEGWFIKLVEAARKENPGNSKLAAIARELLSSETSSAPERSPSNSVTVVELLQEQEVLLSSSITSEFDVFLAYNSADKPQVKEIAHELKRRGLKPWLDEEQIPPGRPFQDEIQQAIPLVKSAARFLGLQGLGSWQSWELRALISSCVKKNIPVIPILLPGVSNLPEHLLFLEQFRWVEFAHLIDDVSALDLLEWGVTGRKPQTTVEYKNKPGLVPGKQQVEKVEAISQPSDDLSSDSFAAAQSADRNVDYTRLRDLLAAGEWKEADEETYLVMLKVVGRKDSDWITDEGLLNFPCIDLRTIDQLWVKYSNGHFGFSVQKKIYLEVGGKPDCKRDEEAWKKFGDAIGWRVKESRISYSEVIFDTIAPVGHLPTTNSSPRYVISRCAWDSLLKSILFSRIQTCKL